MSEFKVLMSPLSAAMWAMVTPPVRRGVTSQPKSTRADAAASLEEAVAITTAGRPLVPGLERRRGEEVTSSLMTVAARGWELHRENQRKGSIYGVRNRVRVGNRDITS